MPVTRPPALLVMETSPAPVALAQIAVAPLTDALLVTLTPPPLSASARMPPPKLPPVEVTVPLLVTVTSPPSERIALDADDSRR